MEMSYTVSQDKKTGLWYAHKVGFPYIPRMIEGRPTFGTKKEALENAAIMMCLPYREYMELRNGGRKAVRK